MCHVLQASRPLTVTAFLQSEVLTNPLVTIIMSISFPFSLLYVSSSFINSPSSILIKRELTTELVCWVYAYWNTSFSKLNFIWNLNIFIKQLKSYLYLFSEILHEMNKDVFEQAEDFITLPKISQVFGEVWLGLVLVAVFFFFWEWIKCLAFKETVFMHLWRSEIWKFGV